MNYLYLPLIFVLTWQANYVQPTLFKDYPILWYDTDTNLKTGDSVLTQFVQFGSPCELFQNVTLVNGTVEELVSWCNKEYDEIVMKNLENLCTPSSLTNPEVKSRKKRFFRKVFGFIGGAVKSFFGLGGRSRGPDLGPIYNQINDLQRTTTFLQQRIDAGEHRQNELERRTAQIEIEVKNLENGLKKTNDEVQYLKDWKQELISSIGTTLILVSKLSAYFEVTKSDFKVILNDWKDKKLNLKLLELFYFEPSLIELYKGTVPQGCHLDIRNSILEFEFKKSNTDFNVHILKANAFTLYLPIENSYLGYKLEYIGPGQVAYDSINNCIVPYYGTATEIILFPGIDDCLPINSLSVYKYWRKSCELMYYLDETSIQFKAIDDFYYVYCYGFNIKLYKTVTPCPNYVFRMHVNETIEILSKKNGTGNSVIRKMKPEDFKPAQSRETLKVTHHLMPKIIELDFQNFNLSNDCPTFGIKFDPLKLGSTNSSSAQMYTMIGVVIFTAIVIILIGFIFYRRTILPELELIRQNRWNAAIEQRYPAIEYPNDVEATVELVEIKGK